ncbi:Uncharacterised protein [uncultured archaeon]|nr:Uncharacterised protein [uncultured archaeon]
MRFDIGRQIGHGNLVLRIGVLANPWDESLNVLFSGDADQFHRYKNARKIRFQSSLCVIEGRHCLATIDDLEVASSENVSRIPLSFYEVDVPCDNSYSIVIRAEHAGFVDYGVADSSIHLPPS